ncbi:MAG: LysM peptidoglycan-binding domain-containing protein [Nitrospirae bacterium]|nr:LysM peptidoglycan-binding domain-containing protein [Nitrospirota bacterium]
MKCLKRFYAVLTFIIAFSFIAQTAGASVSYTVKKGDTLQRISKKYKVKVSELKEANNLKSCKLSTGIKLSIPVSEKNHRTKHASHNSKKDLSKNTAPETSEASHNETAYTVKKGDTFKSVAKKYGTTVNELRRANNLKRGKLKPGQEIVVNAKSHESNVYTVRKGDTLRKIARRFKTNVDNLKEINGLEDNSLKRGQKIYLAKIAPDTKEGAARSNGIYVEKPTRAGTSARLEEVKELATSEEVLADLSIKERLILFAKKMLHLPYHFGGNGAIGLDCSGYVQRVFSFVGENIPRSAREQFSLGEAVDKEDLETGDLVFFKTYASFPSHVGIYLGNHLFIHASSLSKKITIDSLETPYYFSRFIGAKRIIPDDDIDLGISELPTVKVN